MSVIKSLVFRWIWLQDKGMARSRTGPVHDLARDLRALAGVASGPDSVDDLLRRGLDWLARLVPYDLATVFELRGNELVLRVARGPLAGERVRGHSLSLDAFPTIREVIDTRRARAYSERDHAEGDGDPFDGVLDLPPGHSCMVVPLCAGNACFGIATLDRRVCGKYPEATVELVEVYAQILAIAARSAEQQLALERLHRQDHDHLLAVGAGLAAGATRLYEESASPAVRELVLGARQLASTDAPLLVLGEVGAGKRRLARAVHAWSSRAGQPLVVLDGAAGRLPQADGGTLLIAAVEQLSPALQEQLSDVLRNATMRVIVTSSVDLRRAVSERLFSEELYFRLAVSPLTAPPLRDRMQDLELACGILLAERAPGAVRRGAHVTRAGMEHLARHDWPGNLTELANVLERAALVAGGTGLGPDVLELPVRRGLAPGSAAWRARTLADVQREHIRAVLVQTGGRIYGEQGAARLLGLKPSTLQSRMQKLGLDRRDVVGDPLRGAASRRTLPL